MSLLPVSSNPNSSITKSAKILVPEYYRDVTIYENVTNNFFWNQCLFCNPYYVDIGQSGLGQSTLRTKQPLGQVASGRTQ